jgi:hypothetical protein
MVSEVLVPQQWSAWQRKAAHLMATKKQRGKGRVQGLETLFKGTCPMTSLFQLGLLVFITTQ